MELVLRVEKQQLWAGQLTRPFHFESPCSGEDFAMLLAVLDDTVDPDEQAALSGSFVAQGCRYAICYGHGCSTWDDSIDYSFIFTDPNFTPPADRFVMTTWYDNEPIEDVADFFVRNTNFGTFEPVRFMLVALGGTPEQFAQIRDAVTNCFHKG